MSLFLCKMYILLTPNFLLPWTTISVMRLAGVLHAVHLVVFHAMTLQTVSKMFRAEFRKFGLDIGEALPSFTANGSRKLAATALRESGADRGEREALAHHMSADRFSDLAAVRAARVAAISAVRAAYEVRMTLANPPFAR